jgi:hypothetical protein
MQLMRCGQPVTTTDFLTEREMVDLPAESNPLKSVLDAWRERVEAERIKHQTVVASEDYQAQITRLNKIAGDFIGTLALCWFAATRAGEWVDKSFFMRCIDDLNQSAAMVRMAVVDGARNAARRETRYMIELAIKALYVDQQMPMSTFEQRLVFFDRQLAPASIAPVKKLTLEMLPTAVAADAVGRLLAAYGLACQYVHPSQRQIQERLQLAERGISPGFESAAELRQSSDEIFEALGLVLVLLFHAIGSAFTGDIFEAGGLSDRDTWIFHEHALIAAIDEYFDYKSERQASLPAIRERQPPTGAI